MNSSEFRLEFDTQYNNISSGAAPGLDDYDRSYFLSKAQDELVKEWYKDFEKDEKMRRALVNLVQTSTSIAGVDPVTPLVDGSVLFPISQDVQYILTERVELNNGTEVYVKPVTTDEINVVLSDPFMRPSANKIEKFALRLDRGQFNASRVVEILIYDASPEFYKLRYIKKPNPIILSNLTLLGGGISIEGKSNETLCELDSSIHRDIIDRAVVLALEAFEQQRLQTKAQLNEIK